MKILLDIGHPAHVHFFFNSIKAWRQKGHEVLITSRKKEIATDLLDSLGIKHIVLTRMNDGSKLGMLQELLLRDYRLLKLVRREKPDILAGIGGIYIAHVGFVTRTPSITFYDTENATLSNLITYPLTSLVTVPECYQGWLPRNHLKYPGYHELSYLHPVNFSPDKDIAIECGLAEDEPTFLLRVVSWQASHDMSETGWNTKLIENMVFFLKTRGKVIISSEKELPDGLKQYGYKGPPQKIHHLMAFLDMFIGESATMASECAVLGVPSIYAAQTGRGYTDEQEKLYGLVSNCKNLGWEYVRSDIEKILSTPSETWNARRKKLLDERINVSAFITDLILGYPDSVSEYRSEFI